MTIFPLIIMRDLFDTSAKRHYNRKYTDRGREPIQMKRRAIIWMIALLVIAGAVAVCSLRSAPLQKFSSSFFGTFDTIVTVTGYAKNEAAFQKELGAVEDIFTRYHQLFDNYNTYEGINNLFVLNRDAAEAPVAVTKEMMDFLCFVQDLEGAQGTEEVNIAMGSVLRLWHEAREVSLATPENACVPDMAALKAASAHTDFHDLVIDSENGTVFYADPELKLDFGAVAKGYTVERAAEYLASSSMPSFIINAGGNVRTGKAPADGRECWVVGVQDPDNTSSLMDTLKVVGTSVVTSGDYQRYYMLDGKRYHHIISPSSLFPADNFRAVTVITPDSGLADFLSTRLFLLSYEEGRALIDSLPAAEALWCFPDGSLRMTDGYREISSLQREEG